jgi:hypothetical protein
MHFGPETTNQRSQKILGMLLRFALGKEHYVHPTYDRYREPVCIQHPFLRCACRVDYYGRPGHTASIGHFLLAILQSLSDYWGYPLTHVRFYKVPVQDCDTGAKRGHDIYCEARFNGDASHPCAGEGFLVGGMTDYSGEGGGGYNVLRTLLVWLAGQVGADVEIIVSERSASEVYDHIVGELEAYEQALEDAQSD